MNSLPEHVRIRDVSLRDGLQIEDPIPLEGKLELLAAIAATGVKEQREGGDDAVRPELPPQPPDPAGLPPHAAAVLAAHRDLLALRGRLPWLVRAHTDVLHLANRELVLRTGSGFGAVVVALSLDDEPVTLPAADAAAVVAGDGRLDAGSVRLPPRGWAVLVDEAARG